MPSHLSVQANFIPRHDTYRRQCFDKYGAMRKPGVKFSKATDAFHYRGRMRAASGHAAYW